MKNDKKNKGFSPMKKVISAAGMLAVSASMLATSTYAWFTMNTSVTASNMAIKAKTDGSLLISKVNTSEGWTSAGTSIDYELDTSAEAIEVIPASMNPAAAASSWYTASGTDANNGAKPADAAYTELSTRINDATNPAIYGVSTKDPSTTVDDAYALHETFYIKSPTGAMSGLGLSGVNFSKLDSQMSNVDIDKAVCARVEIKTVGGTDTVYTTWAYSGSTSMTYVTGTGATATATGYVLKGSGNDALVKNSLDTATHTIDMVADTAYQVDVYIYLDGENSNCTAAKAYNWKGVDLDLTFSTNTTYANDSN